MTVTAEMLVKMSPSLAEKSALLLQKAFFCEPVRDMVKIKSLYGRVKTEAKDNEDAILKVEA